MLATNCEPIGTLLRTSTDTEDAGSDRPRGEDDPMAATITLSSRGRFGQSAIMPGRTFPGRTPPIAQALHVALGR